MSLSKIQSSNCVVNICEDLTNFLLTSIESVFGRSKEAK